MRRTRRDRGGRVRGDEGKRGNREGSMKVGGRQKWGGGGGEGGVLNYWNIDVRVCLRSL